MTGSRTVHISRAVYLSLESNFPLEFPGLASRGNGVPLSLLSQINFYGFLSASTQESRRDLKGTGVACKTIRGILWESISQLLNMGSITIAIVSPYCFIILYSISRPNPTSPLPIAPLPLRTPHLPACTRH
jgi:hypothetical protein